MIVLFFQKKLGCIGWQKRRNFSQLSGVETADFYKMKKHGLPPLKLCSLIKQRMFIPITIYKQRVHPADHMLDSVHN